MTLLTFGQYLQTKRLSLGLSATQAAKDMGIAISNLHIWEHDKGKPSQKSLDKLIEHYKLSPSELDGYLVGCDIVKRSSEQPIKRIMALSQKTFDEIEAKFNGESVFERTIKTKICNLLHDYCERLREFVIIDEAF